MPLLEHEPAARSTRAATIRIEPNRRASGAALLDDLDGRARPHATFTFDLTFAAQAWTEGVEGQPFANEGILLRPVGAPNLAYGDPDLSTNWVVSLADGTAADAALRPEIRYTTVPAPATDAGTPDPGVGLPDLGTGGATIDFGAPSTGSPGVVSGALGPLRARFADVPAGGEGSTPGWVWVALPLGAVGAVLFAQSLSATPAATRRRPGALTRLMAERELES